VSSPATPLPKEGPLLRYCFFFSVAVLFWSFVGGLVYLLAVQRSLPLQVDGLDEARRRVARKDLKGALREYRSFTHVSPFEIRGFQEMGEILLQERRYDEAAAAFEAALRIRRQSAVTLARLADARVAQGRYADAIALYETALPLAAEKARPDLHNDLGRAYALDGDFERAIQEFSAALALAPHKEAAANRERAMADRARVVRSAEAAP
jgi:tetratricopeptide (TPR) repeat protein